MKSNVFMFIQNAVCQNIAPYPLMLSNTHVNDECIKEYFGHRPGMRQFNVLSFKWTPSHTIVPQVDMVASFLSISRADRAEVSRTLLAMSSSPDCCLGLRQAGCLPLLIQVCSGLRLSYKCVSRHQGPDTLGIPRTFLRTPPPMDVRLNV